MEAVLAILAVIGTIAAFVFKRKADSNAVDATLAKTKTEDKKLEMTQEELENAISAIDASLAKLDAEKAAKDKKDALDSLSLKERADRIKKGLK